MRRIQSADSPRSGGITQIADRPTSPTTDGRATTAPATSRERDGGGAATNARTSERADHPPPSSISVPITQVDVSERETRIVVGIDPLDLVLGGGLVVGSLVLIGGCPGAGKSTLLMQAVGAVARQGRRCLYATGEESLPQVAMRAHRVRAAHPEIRLARETDLDGILWHARQEQASIVVVDSLHTTTWSGVAGIPGSDYQIKAVASQLMAFAKGTGTTVVAISHVNGDGDINGPTATEHYVDATLMLRGDPKDPAKQLVAIKNRFGSTLLEGWFQMTEGGMVPTEARSGQDAEGGLDMDEIIPITQELLYRVLELGGEVDDGLRDRIGGRLDTSPRQR